jgi:hypothetical protein
MPDKGTERYTSRFELELMAWLAVVQLQIVIIAIATFSVRHNRDCTLTTIDWIRYNLYPLQLFDQFGVRGKGQVVVLKSIWHHRRSGEFGLWSCCMSNIHRSWCIDFATNRLIQALASTAINWHAGQLTLLSPVKGRQLQRWRMIWYYCVVNLCCSNIRTFTTLFVPAYRIIRMRWRMIT